MKKKLAAGAGAIAALVGVVTLYLAEPVPVVAPHVYLAIGGTPPVQELWLEREAPLPPLKLNGPLQQTPGMMGFVNSFTVSADGSRVAYTANARAAKPLDFELWAVAITGPPERRLSANLTSDYDVATAIRFDEYGHRVIYRIGRSSIGDWVLWSTLWTGGGTARLSWASMPLGRMVRADFSILGGNWVRFASDYEQDEVFKWYVVRPEGGWIYRELFVDGFESSDIEEWL